MKIICSVGPNIKNEEDLYDFVVAGMNSMRLNFSHADYGLVEKYIKYTRENHPNIEIIADLQGNKIRVSRLFKGQLRVKEKDTIIFCSESYYKKLKPFKEKEIYVPISLDMNFQCLLSASKILMKDATMEFKIEGKTKETVRTKVIRGGIIRAEKGINAPGMDRNSAKLTLKDKKDIKFALKNQVDVICLSYASNKCIIEELKHYIQSLSTDCLELKKIKIWAKIECADGVKNINEISELVDGIMLGRGDLVSEVDVKDIPEIESSIISMMKVKNQELIIATFILESMRNSKTPSISEVESIAFFKRNMVDGIMLAGEVGVGRFPLEVIATAKGIIDRYTFE